MAVVSVLLLLLFAYRTSLVPHHSMASGAGAQKAPQTSGNSSLHRSGILGLRA